jgi:hypothetical protein
VANERIVEEHQGHLTGTLVYQFEPQGSGVQFMLKHRILTAHCLQVRFGAAPSFRL